ncbi:tripartite tricarboxylate transporter substrate binding protein [Variovorax sp. Sphag1AA]|uniref:Bug family tripartite tricarboxylate transporter substrate binding protein n=1 Tax=Variovorax sp. Sphag1AA TaxID=2587027 RepID=UPI001619A45F|nr:tripartite tricarboxylate transporter substrate binding protein [Variovorax sp. Sphag1AA]MBB3181034.1 tripartite-type tricarboxylate transporter receptor subunit TctC [Variovorax sp. Sphag1AA]
MRPDQKNPETALPKFLVRHCGNGDAHIPFARRDVLALGTLGFLPTLGSAEIGRSVKLVVGFAPGGSADLVARLIAPRLGEALGSNVIVENRAGASGTLAAAFVAKSTPDGTTLLVGSQSPVVITPQTLKSSSFDPLADLIGINTVGLTTQVVAVNPTLGIKTLADLLDAARAKGLSLASAGAGGMSHVAIEMLNRASGGRIVHVPYKGSSPGVNDTLAGHVQGVVADLAPVLPFLRERRLLAVAVTNETRFEFLPDVPSANETIADLGAASLAGVLAPSGTPAPIITNINAALLSVMAHADVQARLGGAGFIPSTLASPQHFQRFLARDFRRWGRVIKELNIVSDE